MTRCGRGRSAGLGTGLEVVFDLAFGEVQTGLCDLALRRSEVMFDLRRSGPPCCFSSYCLGGLDANGVDAKARGTIIMTVSRSWVMTWRHSPVEDVNQARITASYCYADHVV